MTTLQVLASLDSERVEQLFDLVSDSWKAFYEHVDVTDMDEYDINDAFKEFISSNVGKEAMKNIVRSKCMLNGFSKTVDSLIVMKSKE